MTPFWVLFSQNNWNDGGNSTEQYGRALAAAGAVFVHGANRRTRHRLLDLEIIPRDEESVRAALAQPRDGRPRIAMFCLPDTASLRYLEMARAMGIRTVYRCVDDWQRFPGDAWYDAQTERRMVALADVAVASSRRMAEDLGVPYLPNACQRLAPAPRPQRPGEPRVVGFCGLADLERFDGELVRELARRFPRVRFEIVGATEDAADGNLTRRRQTTWEAAWQLMQGFDVGLVPYRGAHLAGMQPVKSWEYLGLGIPQMCRRGLDLPEHASVHRYDDADDCAAALEPLLRGVDPAERADARAFAARNTWHDRIRQLQAWLGMDS
ncbi:hypothetical protein KF840_05950 [bacterium]|nr:hypothetical protein [bacterium]